jgi:hypothetical protein
MPIKKEKELTKKTVSKPASKGAAVVKHNHPELKKEHELLAIEIVGLKKEIADLKKAAADIKKTVAIQKDTLALEHDRLEKLISVAAASSTQDSACDVVDELKKLILKASSYTKLQKSIKNLK